MIIVITLMNIIIFPHDYLRNDIIYIVDVHTHTTGSPVVTLAWVSCDMPAHLVGGAGGEGGFGRYAYKFT